MRDDDTITGSRRTGTHGRGRLTRLAVAAAAFVVTGCGASPDGASPTADAPRDTLRLTLAGEAGAGRCLMPTAAALGRADVALDAEVASVADGQVVLRPTRFYAGGPAERVEVAQASRSRQDLILGVRFEEGGRYLVAADGGDVLVCGFSGRHDVRLADLYAEAFARRPSAAE